MLIGKTHEVLRMAVEDLSDPSGDLALLEEEETDDSSDNSDSEETIPEDEGREEKEGTEEVSEEIHPSERPSIKAIQEKYPDILKQFPNLKDIISREDEYSKLYSSIEDAKEASENSEAFVNVREDITSGDGTKFLSAVKEIGSLPKLSRNILSSIFKVDQESFWLAVNPFVENICHEMMKNEAMQESAKILSGFFFGTTDIAEGKKTTQQREEDNSVKTEREKFEQQKDDEFFANTQLELRSKLVSVIDTDKLDKDLPKFVRDHIINKIISDIGSQLQSDKDHMRFMDSLWSKSKRSGRNQESKDKIVNAYIARASRMVPTLRSKYLSEAYGSRKKSTDKSKEIVSRQRVEPGSGKTSKTSGRTNPKNIDWNKTSDLDILNDNF